MNLGTGRRIIKRAFFTALQLLRQDQRLVERIHRSGAIAVLNLHQVSPRANPAYQPLHPDHFDDLLRFLKRNFQVGLLADTTLPERERPQVVLSFDDGYYDFLEYAMPLLHRHGLRANQNVIADCVQSGLPPWNIRLYDFLRVAPCSLVNELRVPGFEKKLQDKSYENVLRFSLALGRHLKNRSRLDRETLWPHIETVIARADDVSYTRMMGVEDVRAAATVHEIGSHSFSHESMAFESDEYFRDDLARCRTFFEGELKQPLSIYAFPNGSKSASKIKILHEAGVEHILLVDEKMTTAHAAEKSRLTISGESRLEARYQALAYRDRV